jgi:hypothetical protein
MDWKRTLKWSFAWLLLSGRILAQDTDNDGIPDAWETANHMNKDSPEDAAVDFDRDGLTSLQEYQLSLLSKGTGVKGKWSATLVDLSGMIPSGSEEVAAKVVAINDEDDVLVNLVGRISPGSVSSAWVRKGSDGTWRQLTTVNNGLATITGYDLNDDGLVVGEARVAGVNGGNPFGFIKDLNALPVDSNVTPWYSESDSVTPVRTITSINDFGDVMGRRADWTSFFQSGFYGDVSPPGTWSPTLFTAINNWGQALGLEYSDPNYGMGLWSHFLLSEGWATLVPFPGVFSEYDLPEFGGEEWELMRLQEISYTPSLINDWGGYAGRYSVTGGEEGEDGYEEVKSGYWYYDGLDHGASPAYRELLPGNYKWQVIHALNNWPQMIVSGTRIAPYAPDPGEPQEYFPKETFLIVEPMRVPLSAIAPDPTVLTHYSFKLIGINNRSTILGSVNNKIYLLKLNQDADGDRMPDDWEEFYGLDPLDSSDAMNDDDGDGFHNLAEFQFGGIPTDDQIGETMVDGSLRDKLDTDADGLPDAWERKFFPNLTLAQVVVADDYDYDFLNNGQEWELGIDPTKKDTDGDGLQDGHEVYWYLTDPTNPDADGDGLLDGDEVTIHTNPLDPSSKGAPPTFLNVSEKATAYDPNVHFEEWWVNWRYDIGFISHGIEKDQDDQPIFPSYSEVSTSHEALAYTGFSDQNPFKIKYPSGTWDYNPESVEEYGTDAFYGEANPTISFGSDIQLTGFRLRSWKVRAERRTAHASPATQTWLVVEEDAETIRSIESFELEIEAGKKASEDEIEVKPSGQGREVRLVPVELAPEVLAVNSDFDEGRIDPMTGYAIPDCDDFDIALEAERDHLDGKFVINERIIDDMHPGFFGVNPSSMSADFWAGANVTITKINKIDAATGYPESGHIRLYGKWGGGPSEYRAIVPYDFDTFVPVDLASSGINQVPGESVYGAASPFPAGTSFFIEGVHPGWITLEWRYQKGDVDVKYEQRFEIYSQKTASQWRLDLDYKIRLETSNDPSGEIRTIEFPLLSDGYKKNTERASEFYDFYGECFQQPLRSNRFGYSNALSWAGLARLAGSQVIGGLSDSQYGKLAIENGVGGVYLYLGPVAPLVTNWSVEEINQLQVALFVGGWQIFSSAGWQHHAYRSSGYRAIEYVATETGDVEAPLMLSAWRDLHQGVLDHDKTIIDSAALEITDREQSHTIVPTWATISGLGLGFVDDMFSILGKNSCSPSGLDFPDLFPASTGNLANTTDRWTWIQPGTPGGILDTWNTEVLSRKLSLTGDALKADAERFSTFSNLTGTVIPILSWDDEDIP